MTFSSPYRGGKTLGRTTKTDMASRPALTKLQRKYRSVKSALLSQLSTTDVHAVHNMHSITHLLRLNPGRELSISQPLAHSLQVAWGREFIR